MIKLTKNLEGNLDEVKNTTDTKVFSYIILYKIN